MTVKFQKRFQGHEQLAVNHAPIEAIQHHLRPRRCGLGFNHRRFWSTIWTDQVHWMVISTVTSDSQEFAIVLSELRKAKIPRRLRGWGFLLTNGGDS